MEVAPFRGSQWAEEPAELGRSTPHMGKERLEVPTCKTLGKTAVLEERKNSRHCLVPGMVNSVKESGNFAFHIPLTLDCRG